MTDYEPPMPNLPLLRKVLDHIDAHPDEWNQGAWIQRTATSSCGTAACIAGWACLINGDQPDFANDYAQGSHTPVVTLDDGASATVAERAQQLLGLTNNERLDLFHSKNDRFDVRRFAGRIAARAGELL